VDDRLIDQTVAVLGPEELTMREVVARVGQAIGRRPRIFPMPVRFHRLLACVSEVAMKVPLVSVAQVQMLAEGLTEPAGRSDELPDDLKPATRFTLDAIRRGLPPPGRFGCRDLRLSPHCPLVRLMQPSVR
jgi:hypothetical protein